MSGHDSKYFSTTKKGEIPELKEELNSQYKVPTPDSLSFRGLLRLWIGSSAPGSRSGRGVGGSSRGHS